MQSKTESIKKNTLPDSKTVAKFWDFSYHNQDTSPHGPLQLCTEFATRWETLVPQEGAGEGKGFWKS